MHRQKSTKFHRRKSTSSAKSVHLEHIHPATAERDAHAAATQAFARARERSATDATLWPPPRNNEPRGSSSYDGMPERRSNDGVVRRRQSVHFIQPNTSRNTHIYANAQNRMPAPNTTAVKVDVSINGVEPRLASSASAAGMVSAAKGTAGDYINALLVGEEYYTPEDDIASAPSSYRRIRKSRSMFAGSESSMASRGYLQPPTSMTMNQIPPSSAGSSNSGADDSLSAAGIKAPKSMSFLRGRRDHPSLFSRRRGSVPMGFSSHESAGISSDKEGPLKLQPSVFLRSKSTNADKFLRKSMRDESCVALPSDGKMPKDGSLRNRARKVSHNVKHRLKSLFSLVKGDTDEAVFPPQQIEASKTHIADQDDPDYMRDDEFKFEQADDEAALSRVPSGIPSLHAVPSCQQLRSRKGSVESLRSERRASDERSRVTSWSNSDTNTLNTMNSHRGEWERQRLSVIKENGMHISSSSARHPGVNTHIANSNASIPSMPPPAPSQPATVDSQRIYSALMKRLDDASKRSQRSELLRQSSIDDFLNTGAVPPRGSSRSLDPPATIRYVASDNYSDSISVRTIERKPVPNSWKSKDGPSGYPIHSDKELDLEGRGLPSSVSEPLANEAKASVGVSDQTTSIPRIKEPISPAKTLSTRSSAFFASPTCHLFRTRSPYRRAIQDSIRTDSEKTQLKSPDFNPWMRSLTSLPIRCPSRCESELDKKMQYAESIYSSNTEEPVTRSLNNTSAVVGNFPKPPSFHGDATIFVDPPVYRPSPPIPPKPRVTSSASSVEWKTWLSANVSKLEGAPDRTDASVLEYTVPSTRPSGHIREKAQIEDEDEQLPLEVYKPTRPDSALATIEQNAKASPHTPRLIKKSTSPIPHREKENEAPEVPTVPSRNMLRTTPSLASMRSAREVKSSTESQRKGAFDSIRRKSLAHKASLNTLAGNTSSTRKLVKKQQSFGKYTTPTSSPRLTTAVDRQSGKVGGSTDSKRKLGIIPSMKTENVSPNVGSGADADTDPYGVQGSGVLGPDMEHNAQSIGSKKMVDLFLSSRRRRMASGDDGGVFL
ncbi:hypothetical protein GGR54DRAFT_602745 [Hypoxylon sp. NC1633]|nr:hypothetical protein GGR54DRAFT_602745 [Hypoxylon sp. NC1633]